MNCRTLMAFSIFACAAPAYAVGTLVDVDVRDVTTGRMLPVYRHDGAWYVAGEPGHEYTIDLASRESGRVLAVASVDGVNVVTGETADPGQSGYVLSPFQRYGVLGWRTSLERIASFFFTRVPDSYAARTGRAHDVGVIGVAVFREREVVREEPPLTLQPRGMAEDSVGNAPAPAPPAASESRAKSAAAAPVPQKLGTDYGRGQDSVVTNTDFERASATPAEVITLYYDSRSNLVARGVIPPAYAYTPTPDPFPGHFVPPPP